MQIITLSESNLYSRNTFMDFIEHRQFDIEICDVTLRTRNRLLSKSQINLKSKRASLGVGGVIDKKSIYVSLVQLFISLQVDIYFFKEQLILSSHERQSE
jgi:hypothetical protein